MSAKKTLQNLLIAGETTQVLRALTVLADQLGDNALMNDAVYQAERWGQLNRERAAGLDAAKAMEREQKIQQALLFLIEGLPGEG